MKKLVLLSGVVALAFSAQAQQFVKEYITQPSSHELATNVNKWNSGQTMLNGDENFYISRVKPKARFRNAATQVNESFTDGDGGTDKRLVMWVPLNVIQKHWDNSAQADIIDLSPDTYPNGKFDSEVFSAWSYVDHFGDWNSPIGWIQGNFADVAHKNGVGVSGQASVPWGSLGSDWNTALTAQANLDNTVLAKFLHYHGVDGLSYNSEWSGGSGFLSALRTQHADVIKYLESKGNMVAENIWYDGTNDSGGCTFDRGLGSHNAQTFGDGNNRRTSLFLNYNWDGALGNLNQSTVDRLAPGRSVKDLYAGFNMQGADDYNIWSILKNSELSIGMWGAHDHNYIWSARIANGGADITKQETYQDLLATFFTNGNHNPIRTLPVVNGMGHTDSQFFGMSSMMSARSSLSWDLAAEPFYSFFNLGNGQFFNWMGERQNDGEWYNIGVQDYLPTWRWWFATKFLGKASTDALSNGLKAGFTFNDAYVGGSCLRIHGTSTNEFLHLFKTKFALKSGDVITVRYKLVNGSANVNLALSVEGAESTILRETSFSVVTSTDEADDGVWETKTFTISGALNSAFNNKTLAMVALHFQNAANLDLYLGEFSITRGTSASTAPATPVIDTNNTKILSSHPKGVDAKIIFNMPGAKAKPEPTYNIDVKTSLFKLYAQQEGKDPILMGITTSWAGMYYSIPTDWNGTEKVRLGVAAVSLDYSQESNIAWTSYLTIPATSYKTDETVQINKTVIKPNESFEISYVDPKHALSTWKLKNSTGTVVKQASNTLVFSVPEGLSAVGAYDLVIDEGTTKARTLASYVQITPDATGALPEIYSLSVNNSTVQDGAGSVDIKQGDQVTLGYTGRDADGAVSRGIKLAEKCVGFKASDLGIGSYQSFAVAAWVNYETMPGACNFFGIEDRGGDTWPNNNWGWLWGTHQGDGTFGWTFCGGNELKYTFPNTKLVANAWTHVVFVFEYSGSKFRSLIYINGVLQESTWTFNGGSGTTLDWTSNYQALPSKDWMNFGGGRGATPAINDGIIDELVVWNGSITQAQVTDLYNGQVSKYLSSNIKGYWSFDTDANSSHYFIGQGTVSNPKACAFETVSTAEEGQGIQTPIAPTYISGCPFISGATFPVTTTPTWKANRGTISNAQGTGEAGSAKLSYSKVGDFTVTLTLANSLGEAKATYPVFKVASGVNEVDQNDMRVYTIDESLFVEFAEDGDYQVAVYNVAGVQVAHKAATVVAGENMLITLNADGVYVVNVMKDGKVVRTIKVVKK